MLLLTFSWDSSLIYIAIYIYIHFYLFLCLFILFLTYIGVYILPFRFWLEKTSIISIRKIVLSLLMTKTYGAGMIFLVTWRQVGFARYLEQCSSKNLQSGLPDGDRKEPMRCQHVYPYQNRGKILCHGVLSVKWFYLFLFNSFKVAPMCIECNIVWMEFW